VPAEPELFVVCKNCGSEVSPYVTECPYCGQRVRKRAPKLDKAGSAPPKEKRQRRRPSLSRLRSDEIPGIAPETRPYTTLSLIAACALVSVALGTGSVDAVDIGRPESLDNEQWRLVTTAFVTDNLGYLFITMVAVGVFGMHLERRYGAWAPILVFVVSGTAGAALAVAADMTPVEGANGAALGMLCAWLWDDRMAARRGDDRENDLLAVYVGAAVLVLLSLADETASLAAAAGGAAAGSVIGLMLSMLRR
jgi:membrane associated rhomboid family serine protease